jgi:pimeloyl-ACP methyl ester carboxylesterase
MTREIISLRTLVLSLFLVSCAVPLHEGLSPSKVWTPEERTGLESADEFKFAVQRLISVPLNPDDPTDGNFDLYYFVQSPRSGTGLKTLLFCAGGPGDLARPSAKTQTLVDFLNNSGYNVVYFDLRGTGFSQLPSSNRFDRFLRTAYAVEDIERIRQDFLGNKKWDAIVGYSYGTVLAQEYAHKFQDKVGKLVQVGPLSMHKFLSSPTAYDEYNREVQRIRREVLDELYKRDEFKSVSASDRKKIMDDLFGASKEPGIFKRVEDVFGSEQFVIDEYCDLKRRGILKKYYLGNYSRRFFEMLRKIRLIGWQTVQGTSMPVDSDQLDIVQVISLELKPDLEQVLGKLAPDQECTESYSQKSNRVFNVMGLYDGINRRFLREWLADGQGDIHNALARSAGLAHVEMGVNTSIDKIGITKDEHIVPWDPAKYPHSVPTLIIKGGADPVTAAGQAEYYYTDALSGARTLIEFKGVGHSFYFPGSEVKDQFADGAVVLDPPNIPPGKKAWVTGTISNVQAVDNKMTDGDLIFLEVRLGTTNNAVMQVVNKSNSIVHMSAKEIPIDDMKFKGVVSLGPQDIPGNVATWLPAKITVTGIKFQLASPSSLEAGLQFTGEVFTDSWNKISVEIANNKAISVDGAARNWIYKPSLKNKMCVAEADVTSLTCLIYAFVELEYADFIKPESGVLDRLRVFTPISKNCWEKGCDPLGD